MAIPYPKPEKNKRKNKSRGSDGSEYTQSMIEVRLRQSYANNPKRSICECCGFKLATDHSHIISQKRCKELHITEIIWSPLNWALSCRSCHLEYESYKSGKFSKHLNILKTMNVLKAYDPEAFNKRINYINDDNLKNQLL